MDTPVLNHVSVRIVGYIGLAVQLFEALGWILEVGRNPTWETGESVFLHHPDGGVYLQLTVEGAGFPGDPTDAFHIALSCDDVAATLAVIQKWCGGFVIPVFVEELGGGKMMISIPDLLYGAIELVNMK